MRNFWLTVALLCTVGIFAPRAHAEAPAPHAISVAIYCSCDDAVGQAYVAAVKVAIANQPAYREVAYSHSNDQGVLSVSIISMPIENDGKPSSALSIVMMHNGSMVHQFITTCDKIPVTECAKQMVDGLRDVL